LDADPEVSLVFALAERLSCPVWMIRRESSEDFDLWLEYLRRKDKS